MHAGLHTPADNARAEESGRARRDLQGCVGVVSDGHRTKGKGLRNVGEVAQLWWGHGCGFTWVSVSCGG